MVLRNVVKVMIAAGEAVGRAFTKAVKEELNASRHAAERNATASASSSSAGSSRSKTHDEAKANARLGITLQESMQILDIKALDNKEEIEQRFKHLFEINEKEKGGTLYMQSKVYRAKERIDAELTKQGETAKPEEKS